MMKKSLKAIFKKEKKATVATSVVFNTAEEIFEAANKVANKSFGDNFVIFRDPITNNSIYVHKSVAPYYPADAAEKPDRYFIKSGVGLANMKPAKFHFDFEKAMALHENDNFKYEGITAEEFKSFCTEIENLEFSSSKVGKLFKTTEYTYTEKKEETTEEQQPERVEGEVVS